MEDKERSASLLLVCCLDVCSHWGWAKSRVSGECLRPGHPRTLAPRGARLEHLRLRQCVSIMVPSWTPSEQGLHQLQQIPEPAPAHSLCCFFLRAKSSDTGTLTTDLGLACHVTGEVMGSLDRWLRSSGLMPCKAGPTIGGNRRSWNPGAS